MKPSKIITVLALATLPAMVHAQALTNPLGTPDIREIIGNVIKALLGLSGAVALLVFVWSGILMIVAAGSPEKIKKAKSSLVWATIGLVVIFTAYTLVATLISVLSTGSGQ
ncbi:hypothetical protein A2348_02285 [Candidatus Uhrbacteria bacterium RIFOXYB12_FULL_58_10]|uniref:Conjugal transfer protein TrbC n=1 Tax=Candidatus Uhrbacteria bacterium RIFOXYB2_FULL_57_15 TaxID=1802422 RepID=A0A1F7WAK8_9BACT|nr:MAG: hypothetical protein A2348_02285 [Candidatus Uhrbacteria bacterium RIFOXYB12_FULL_58_10]OGL99626.1 MAG: hypothetical protein A2304_04460 [Candidatus Uhrbacteria bacterium RIFOXYB2_FULL_57_15]OGM00449.1 MAG: hypothetical protein A2501_00600 [Candidatus Uhrbacteria bacterium RIFOXYC12_FULL_57_11]